MWQCFPSSTSAVTEFASPQLFRLLVLSGAGRMVIASISLRTPPQGEEAEVLSKLIDNSAVLEGGKLRIQGEFEAQYGHTIELSEADLDHDDALLTTNIVSRAVTLSVRSGIKSLKDLKETLTRRYSEEWETTRNRFIQRLDANAVSAARKAGGLTPSLYNSFSLSSPAQRRNRAQAFTLFPILRDKLDSRQYATVREAVDNGKSLVDALAALWGCKKSLVRRLRGVTEEDLGEMGMEFHNLMTILKEIPLDWWPASPAGWSRFGAAVDSVRKISRRPVTSASNLLWLRKCAKDGFQVEGRTPEDLYRRGEEIYDFMRMLHDALEWTFSEKRMSCPGYVPPSVSKVVSQFRAANDIERLSFIAHRYGSAYRRANEQLAKEMDYWSGVSWPTLFADSIDYQGMQIVALCTPQELQQEGIRMRNCVASYAGECMTGRCQIWSIRKCGRSVANLETRISTVSNGQVNLHSVQLRGVGNSDPPHETHGVVAFLNQRVKESVEEVSGYMQWRRIVSHRTLDQRLQFGLMLPIVAALKETLPKGWSWEVLNRSA